MEEILSALLWSAALWSGAENEALFPGRTNDCDLSDLTAVRFDPALVQTAAAVHT